MVSLSSVSCTQVMRYSMYSGAVTLIGFLIFSPSAQKYSNLGRRQRRHFRRSLLFQSLMAALCLTCIASDGLREERSIART